MLLLTGTDNGYTMTSLAFSNFHENRKEKFRKASTHARTTHVPAALITFMTSTFHRNDKQRTKQFTPTSEMIHVNKFYGYKRGSHHFVYKTPSKLNSIYSVNMINKKLVVYRK